MKVVVAMDSLKGSLSSVEANNAVKKVSLLSKPDAHVIVKTYGGRGAKEPRKHWWKALEGDKIRLTVTGPFGKPVESFLWMD